MKRYVLILALAVTAVSFTKAQQKVPTATEITNKSIDALDKKVKLNPTQKGIIYNYMLDISKEQLALSKKQQSGTFGEEDMSRFYRMQNETQKSIRNILKGDQQVEYDKFIEEQLRGGEKKKKKGKHSKDEEEEVVTGISGLKTPPANP